MHYCVAIFALYIFAINHCIYSKRMIKLNRVHFLLVKGKAMRIEDIRDFIIVSKCKSFTEGAQKLYTSRYTLIRNINKLESELGKQLFSRSSQGIDLTEAGREFLAKATDLIKIYDGLFDAADIPVITEKKIITVGIRASLSSAYYLRWATEYYLKEHEDLKIELVLCNSDNIERSVINGDLDICYSTIPPQDDLLIGTPILRRKYVLLANRNSRVAQNYLIKKEDLREEKIVIHTFSASANSRLYYYLNRDRLLDNVIFETEDFQLIYRIVNNNDACGMLNERDALIGAALFEDLKVIPIDPDIEISTGILYCKNRKLSQAEKDYIAYLQTKLPELYN